MAGHSKWANIKHRKAASDARKGKIYSKLAKEIIVAAKLGGADPETNSRLKAVITRAKSAGLPKHIIQNNLDKSQSKDQAAFVQNYYELYGHGGVGIILDVMTDNPNRIMAHLNTAKNKKGGALATQGSVMFNFDHKGVLLIKKGSYSEEELFDLVSNTGGEEIEFEEDSAVVLTAPESLYEVQSALEKASIEIESSSLEMQPKHTVEVSDELMAKNRDLLEFLEEIEEVDNIYHNMQEKE